MTIHNSIFGIIDDGTGDGQGPRAVIRTGGLGVDPANNPQVWRFGDKGDAGTRSVLIGYRLADGDGEYIRIELDGSGLTIQTDDFGSYTLYYGYFDGRFVFGTELNDLLVHGFDRVEVDLTRLIRYLAFGYPALEQETFYPGIRFLEPRTRLRLRLAPGSPMEARLERHPVKNDSGSRGKSARQILQNVIRDRVNALGPERIILLVTAGFDSGVLLDNFSTLNIPVLCATYGDAGSDDVRVGRERARLCGYPHTYSDAFSRLGRSGLHDYLGEYSFLTGGIGQPTEIDLLHFVRRTRDRGDLLIIGGGGEFYRNYLKSDAYFVRNYLTALETLSRFTGYTVDTGSLVAEIHSKCGDGNPYEAFYVQERYPKNTCRKFQITKNDILMINPLVNRFLYHHMFSHTDFEMRASNRAMALLQSEIPRFEPNHEIRSPHMNINNFFSRIQSILEDTLKNGYDMTRVGIHTDRILDALAGNSCSIRDKWFLPRVLNLSLYLTRLEKDLSQKTRPVAPATVPVQS